MEKILQGLKDIYGDNLKLRTTSYNGFSPGDLLVFEYTGSWRIGLVVSSQRTSTGIFLSTRLNTLVNVFTLNALTEDMFVMVVNNLYNNPSRCTYKNTPVVLGSFLGKDFRTFNVHRMDSVYLLSITK